MSIRIKKQRIFRHAILSIVCYVYLIGCQPAVPIPTAMATATPTLLPTSTATPTAVPVITLQNMDDQFPGGFLQFDPDFAGLPSGTYLIGTGLYVDSSGEYDYVGGFSYVSLEDSLSGKFGVSRNVLGDYINAETKTVSHESYSAISRVPEYMTATARLTPTHQIDIMFILSVNFLTKEQHILKAEFNPASGMQCDSVSVSPNHKWVAGNCWRAGENYVYFLNLQNGTARTLHSTDRPCLSSEYGSRYWQYFSWSSDGQRLAVSCETSNQDYISCLAAPAANKFDCRPNGYYRPEAWSPDGSEVAVIEHHSDHNDELLVTDAACLGSWSSCPEYYRSSLEPIWDKPGFYTANVIWSPTGESVIWSINADYLDRPGPTTIWVANLENGEKYHIYPAVETTVSSISPDGRWMLVSMDGLKLLSIDGQTSRGIPNFNGGFLGWLVVP